MEFIAGYFKDFVTKLNAFAADDCNIAALQDTVKLLKAAKAKDKKIILLGNGGSSAIAEHMAVDLTKNAGLRAIAFSGSPLLTTYANDYGYENVFSECIERFMDIGDVVMAISSSGTSVNIIKACEAAKAKDGKLITFTGFSQDNPVSKLGSINFHVPSRAFGFVEIIHNLLIHCINDAVIGSQEYFIKGSERGN